MEQNNLNVNFQEDEISLREIIEALLRGKRIIAITVLVVLVVTAVASFMIIPKKYEAASVVLVSPVAVAKETPKQNSIDNIIDYMNNYPMMTVKTYVNQIKTPQILEKTIKTLDLKNKDGKYMNVKALDSIITVDNIKDTNLISIKVNYKDPKQAALIANTLSRLFIEFVTENNKIKSEQAANLIEKQLILEEKNVAKKSQVVAEYLANSVSIDELNREVSSLVSQITSSKANQNSVDMQIKADEKALSVLLDKANIGKISNINNIKFDLDTNGNVRQEFRLNNISDNDLQSALLTINITKIQTRLVENSSKKEALVTKIKEMQKTLLEKQTLLAEEKYKYDALNRDLQLANQAYNAYQQRHKEAMIAAATDIGSTSIIVSSEAMAPESPVSPNKKLNMAIGLVLGLFIGVFIVFIKEYWKNTEQVKKEGEAC